MHTLPYASEDPTATAFVCPVCGESFASEALRDAHYRGMGQTD